MYYKDLIKFKNGEKYYFILTNISIKDYMEGIILKVKNGEFHLTSKDEMDKFILNYSTDEYFIIECFYKDNLIEDIINELYKYKSLMEIIE